MGSAYLRSITWCAIAGALLAAVLLLSRGRGSSVDPDLQTRSAPLQREPERAGEPALQQERFIRSGASTQSGERRVAAREPLREEAAGLTRGPEESAAPELRRTPHQLVYGLETLVARRSEFADSREYWERFEQLKQAFVAMGAESVPLLEEKIVSADAPARLRRSSVILVGAIKSEQSIPLLADLLREDADPEVRRLAARALANYRPSPRARQILIEELVHGEPFNGSFDVVYSLSTFQNRSDIELFKKLAASHREVSIRTQAVHALGSTKDPDLVPFLLSVARSDPHPDPRSMAAQLIRELEP